MIKPTKTGRYQAVWYEDRKPKQRTFSTRRLAQDHIAHMRLQKERKVVYGPDNRIPLLTVIEQYCKEKDRCPAIKERDIVLFDRWKVWFAQKNIKFVNQINKGKIREYESSRVGVSQRTINIDIKTLAAALNHAVRYDRATFNPLAQYPYKPDKSSFQRFLTAEEIDLILHHSGPERDILYTMLTMGLRSQEACFLRYCDVKNNMVHIGKKTISVNREIIQWVPKWKKERYSSFDADYANDDFLKSRLGGRADKEFCFLRPNGEVYDRHYLHFRFKRILKAAGILYPEELKPHTMRHTHVSYMAARVSCDPKITIPIVMANVGIGDLKTFLVYMQVVRNLGKNLPDPLSFPWQVTTKPLHSSQAQLGVVNCGDSQVVDSKHNSRK